MLSYKCYETSNCYCNGRTVCCNAVLLLIVLHCCFHFKSFFSQQQASTKFIRRGMRSMFKCSIMQSVMHLRSSHQILEPPSLMDLLKYLGQRMCLFLFILPVLCGLFYCSIDLCTIRKSFAMLFQTIIMTMDW